MILKSCILISDIEWRLKEGRACCKAEIQWGHQNHLTSALSRMTPIANEIDFALKFSARMASDSKKIHFAYKWLCQTIKLF